ncbi:MAG: hypothetical protein FJ284_08445 [Planctomycetes bacterium]|nr:hypothetical protein [Planctomycetota bacterium]
MQRGFLQATTIALVSLGAVVLRGADAGVRPEGSFVRPREHVRGFDLDEAWQRYDATVATESTKFVDVLNGLIDAAKQKQDASELTKWSDVLDEFREEGVFPSIKMIKEQVGEAKASLARAGQQLPEKGYERALEEASGKPQPNRAEIDALRGEMVIVKNNPFEGPKIFLRDLQEEELVFVPPFVGGQPFQKNEFFHVGGQVRPRSIFHHPPPPNPKKPDIAGFSRAKFAVPAGYRRMPGSVAMNDSSNENGCTQLNPVIFKILDDRGKSLWSSDGIPVKGKPWGQKEQKFDVLLPDTARTVTLQLEVRNNAQCCHALWCTPSFRR